jgi:hypothetical protein
MAVNSALPYQFQLSNIAYSQSLTQNGLPLPLSSKRHDTALGKLYVINVVECHFRYQNDSLYLPTCLEIHHATIRMKIRKDIYQYHNAWWSRRNVILASRRHFCLLTRKGTTMRSGEYCIKKCVISRIHGDDDELYSKAVFSSSWPAEEFNIKRLAPRPQ